MNASLVAAMTVALSVPLAAQWLNHPTPGIPRTPDGKGPSGNKCVTSGRRGARPARREERAYRAYASDEQRSPAGCIGGQNGAVISGRALTRFIHEGADFSDTLVIVAQSREGRRTVTIRSACATRNLTRTRPQPEREYSSALASA